MRLSQPSSLTIVSDSSSAPFSSPKGTRDLLSPESGHRRDLLQGFIKEATLAGYQEIVLPLFEEAGVFARVGESTEIVQKQMYDFYDKDERHMVLRPESTASVMRAYIQHRPTLPWKVWYEGAHFRYERPQAGRFRQFHQVGAELLGTDDPLADVEIILLGWKFLKNFGAGVELLINSLGDLKSRAEYSKSLNKYLSEHKRELSSESQDIMELNPLRVLDSKREDDKKVIVEAPLLSDFLSPEDTQHFAQVCSALESFNVPYKITPRLVRGLDYYTRTTFEYISKDLDSAQNALGGGGRYDGLSEHLKGPPCPGVGFAIGLDRTFLALKNAELENMESAQSLSTQPSIQVFVADLLGGKPALDITQELRNAGIAADRAFGNRSLKSQMKLADRSGAILAVIIGEDEEAENSVSLVELRKSDLRMKMEQDLIPRQQLVAEINKRLSVKP